MYIEDLLIELIYNRIGLNSYDSNLVYSFYDQISRGNGLTEKQSVLAVRIVKRYGPALASSIQKNIDGFIQNPQFRLPIRKISSERRLSIVDHRDHGRVIKAVFPYNEKLVESIRKNRDSFGTSLWDREDKCWYFSVSESAIQFLSNLENFEVDELLQSLQEQIANIQRDMEEYVPMLIIENLVPKLKNCDKNVPELIQTDLISAIFEARKRGINTWDETINNFIDSDEVDPITRDFLKTDPSEKFGVDSETYEISRIAPIISNLLPVIVIIPGGDELDKMSLSVELFKNIGISNNDMSVMFRLPSTTHQIFNEFVKFNELNSPIGENTKVVFVSSKIPKPIFKSGIKFNSVLNLGYSNVHYTMRDFVKNHENSIMYSKEKDIKNLRYGFL
jgi:hypothetical protein